MKITHIFFITLFSCLFQQAYSQVLNAEGKVELRLHDGQEVILYPAYENSSRLQYYYLPTAFRLSEKKGVPEFSFITYSSEEGGPIIGGIMHFLVVWGLTEDQTNEINQYIVTNVDSNAVLMGSAVVRNSEAVSGLKLSGKSKLKDLFIENLTSAAPPSVFPGTKQAFSFRFDGDEANEMDEAIKKGKELNDLKIIIAFEYDIMSRGVSESVIHYLEGDLGKWLK